MASEAQSAQDALEAGWSEPQFEALVDALAADPDRREQLIGLLREDHKVYDQRGAATIVRMRGWILLALGRIGLSDAALIFVLEELDTGTDAYLVAAAARALRSYPRPDAAFAPFLMRAITNIRYRNEPVSFETYGEYATSSAGTTSPLRELLAAITWLGAHARGILPELEALRGQGGAVSRKLRIDFERAMQAIRGVDEAATSSTHACCSTLLGGMKTGVSRPMDLLHPSEQVEAVILQDHNGDFITFREYFQGNPSIVAFFYTRCDNPLKCSLTVTKLGNIQKILATRGLAHQIRTAVITYDPAFDIPERLRVYGTDRGLRMDSDHRMLRAADGADALRRYFELGVNFIESLVNRHRIELYVLDAKGRIAVSFERIHWDEQQVVTHATEVLKHKQCGRSVTRVDPVPSEVKSDCTNVDVLVR